MLVGPAEFVDLEPRLCLGLLLCGWGVSQIAAHVAAIKHEVCDAVRMAYRVAHGDGAAGPSHREQHEAIDARGGNDRIQVLSEPGEGKLHALAIGQSAAAPVIADERIVARQKQEPRTPDWALPIELQVMNPVLHPDQRRAGAARRIGDAHAIGARTEANFLLALRHADRT